MDAWTCERCKTIHTQNPDSCRSCGHRIFRPTQREELERRSGEIDSPQAMTDFENAGSGGKEPDHRGSPDVAIDGSIKRGTEGETDTEDKRSPRPKRVVRDLRVRLSVFVTKQRYNVWTLVQVAGFAAFFFGAFRLFGIGIYGMEGLGPIPRSVFTTVWLPGPWSASSVVWELAWIWMGIGVGIVAISTWQSRIEP